MHKVITHVQRIAAVSTYFENIGDELIREGMMYQLRSALGNQIRFDQVSKSNALSLFLPVSAITHAPTWRMPTLRRRIVQRAGRTLERARPWPLRDRVAKADLVAFAGTPLFYFTAGQNFYDQEPWPKTIFENRIAASGGPHLIAMGVGSILEHDVDQTLSEHPKAADFLRRFVDRATLITTRDDDTAALLRAANPQATHKVHRMICPSIWGRRNLNITPATQPIAPKRALVGYSEESASWDGRGEDVRIGRRGACHAAIMHLRKHGYDVQLIAHNDLDEPPQRRIAADHGLPAPIRVSARTLLQQAAQARLMVTWRVHGAMAGLSMGLSTLLFRTDSRFAMAEQLGASILDDRETLSPGDTLDRIAAAYDIGYQRRINSLNQRCDEQLQTLTEALRESL